MKPPRPPFILFPVLSNAQVILRDFQKSDLDAFVEISFYDGIPARDSEAALMMQERIREDYKNGNSVHWILCSTASGEILGTCGFYRGFEDDIGEIGYVLKKAHQGNGYMGQALSLLLDFGWRELKLKMIKGVTSSGNTASMKVLVQSGFWQAEVVGDEVTFLVGASET